MISIFLITLVVITFYCIYYLNNAKRHKYYVNKSAVLQDFCILEKAILDFYNYYGYMPLVNKNDDLQIYGLIEVLVGKKYLDGSPANDDVSELNPDLIHFLENEKDRTIINDMIVDPWTTLTM